MLDFDNEQHRLNVMNYMIDYKPIEIRQILENKIIFSFKDDPEKILNIKMEHIKIEMEEINKLCTQHIKEATIEGVINIYMKESDLSNMSINTLGFLTIASKCNRKINIYSNKDVLMYLRHEMIHKNKIFNEIDVEFITDIEDSIENLLKNIKTEIFILDKKTLEYLGPESKKLNFNYILDYEYDAKILRSNTSITLDKNVKSISVSDLLIDKKIKINKKQKLNFIKKFIEVSFFEKILNRSNHENKLGFLILVNDKNITQLEKFFKICAPIGLSLTILFDGKDIERINELTKKYKIEKNCKIINKEEELYICLSFFTIMLEFHKLFINLNNEYEQEYFELAKKTNVKMCSPTDNNNEEITKIDLESENILGEIKKIVKLHGQSEKNMNVVDFFEYLNKECIKYWSTFFKK